MVKTNLALINNNIQEDSNINLKIHTEIVESGRKLKDKNIRIIDLIERNKLAEITSKDSLFTDLDSRINSEVIKINES